MISYVKILGPPVKQALDKLEKIAIDIPTICIMDKFMVRDLPPGHKMSDFSKDIGFTYVDNDPLFGKKDEDDPSLTEWASKYFSSKGIEISTERCTSIISKSEISLGEYDFYFEWLQEPDLKELIEIIEKIDDALLDLNCHYTITTI